MEIAVVVYYDGLQKMGIVGIIQRQFQYLINF